MSKYIFITGGVMSTLGKGILSSSLGRILKDSGFSVSILKFDPYLNVDAGSQNPYEHGEVFVTEDGGETDLDLGHYERFLEEDLSKVNNVTSGQVYLSVIEKERKGDYLGSTVQIIPHLTKEIKDRIHLLAHLKNADILIVEVGGTVGDIEGLPFLEAIREFKLEEKEKSVLYIHLTYVPFIEVTEEAKTKPTQHSVQELRRIGIQPDIIIARSKNKISNEAIGKIALFGDLKNEKVFSLPDLDSVYKVPHFLKEEGLGKAILSILDLKPLKDEEKWKGFLEKLNKDLPELSLAITGKYVKLKDSYLSLKEALIHASLNLGYRLKINFVSSEDIEEKGSEILEGFDGILTPGGFGKRGIEGMIESVKFARESKVPFLGICLGMQIASIEIARDLLNLKDANSEEFDKETKNYVIHLMPSQRKEERMGGTMRLGGYPAKIKENTLLYDIYKIPIITERHRHRYEFNNKFRSDFESHGITFSGIYEREDLVEAFEIKDHPFFVAVQYHPEFKSKPTNPHPLFVAFIKALAKKRYGK